MGDVRLFIGCRADRASSGWLLCKGCEYKEAKARETLTAFTASTEWKRGVLIWIAFSFATTILCCDVLTE